MASKQEYSNFVYVFTNKSSLKVSSEDAQNGAFTLKRGVNVYPKGEFFRNLWYCDSSSAMKQSYHCCLESKIMDSGLKICNSLPSLLQLFFLSIVLVMLCTMCAGFVSPG